MRSGLLVALCAFGCASPITPVEPPVLCGAALVASSEEATGAIARALLLCGEARLVTGSFVSSAIVLPDDARLHVGEGAKLIATADGYPTQAVVDQLHQDFAHGSFVDSFILCDGCRGAYIGGGGTLEGKALSKLEAPGGGATKMITLKSARDITIENLRLHEGGWISILATNVTNLVLRGVEIRAHRDGINIVSSRHVLIDMVHVFGGSDDAIALKSDMSLGKRIVSHSIVVRNSLLQSVKCNAIGFGSETVANFYNIHFENIHIYGAGKSAISIVTIDGADIFRVRFENITVTDVASVLFMWIGARMRRPIAVSGESLDKEMGSIHDVTIKGLVAERVGLPTELSDMYGNFSASIDGQPALDWRPGSKKEYATGERISRCWIAHDHPVGPNILLEDVKITVQGGEGREGTTENPAHMTQSYLQRNMGPTPASGLFVRHAERVKLRNWEFTTEANDDRPALIFDHVTSSSVIDATLQRGKHSSFDIGFRNKAQVRTERVTATYFAGDNNPRHGKAKATTAITHDEGAFAYRKYYNKTLQAEWIALKQVKYSKIGFTVAGSLSSTDADTQAEFGHTSADSATRKNQNARS